MKSEVQHSADKEKILEALVDISPQRTARAEAVLCGHNIAELSKSAQELPKELASYLDQASRDAEIFRETFLVAGRVVPQFEIEAPQPTGEWHPKTEAILLNDWLAKPEAVQTINSIFEAALDLAVKLSDQAVAGHDARHFLIKDGIATLRMFLEDRISDYRQLALLPAVFHDCAKHFEERKVGNAKHADIAFAVLKDIIDDFPEVPSVLRVHLLTAVLDHTKSKATNSFIAQAVATADRFQLTGPEMISRQFLHGSGMKCKTIDQVLSRVGFYSRNLFPQIGSRGEERATEYKAIVGTFVWLAAGETERLKFFRSDEIKAVDPEAEVDNQEENELKPYSGAVLEKIRGNLQAHAKVEDYNLLDLLKELVSPEAAIDPETALPLAGQESVWQNIVLEIEKLSPAQQVNMLQAVAYALQAQKEDDANDRRVIAEALNTFDPDSLAGRFARWLE